MGAAGTYGVCADVAVRPAVELFFGELLTVVHEVVASSGGRFDAPADSVVGESTVAFSAAMLVKVNLAATEDFSALSAAMSWPVEIASSLSAEGLVSRLPNTAEKTSRRTDKHASPDFSFLAHPKASLPMDRTVATRTNRGIVPRGGGAVQYHLFRRRDAKGWARTAKRRDGQFSPPHRSYPTRSATRSFALRERGF